MVRGRPVNQPAGEGRDGDRRDQDEDGQLRVTLYVCDAEANAFLHSAQELHERGKSRT